MPRIYLNITLKLLFINLRLQLLKKKSISYGFSEKNFFSHYLLRQENKTVSVWHFWFSLKREKSPRGYFVDLLLRRHFVLQVLLNQLSLIGTRQIRPTLIIKALINFVDLERQI